MSLWVCWLSQGWCWLCVGRSGEELEPVKKAGGPKSCGTPWCVCVERILESFQNRLKGQQEGVAFDNLGAKKTFWI